MRAAFLEATFGVRRKIFMAPHTPPLSLHPEGPFPLCHFPFLLGYLLLQLYFWQVCAQAGSRAEMYLYKVGY